jgi:hypothetical protein
MEMDTSIVRLTQIDNVYFVIHMWVLQIQLWSFAMEFHHMLWSFGMNLLNNVTPIKTHTPKKKKKTLWVAQ